MRAVGLFRPVSICVRVSLLTFRRSATCRAVRFEPFRIEAICRPMHFFISSSAATPFTVSVSGCFFAMIRMWGKVVIQHSQMEL